MDFETGSDLISLKESLQDLRTEPSEWEDPDMEADEYARWNGLTVDSRFEPWPRLVDDDIQISTTVDGAEPGSLFEIPFLQECLFREIIPTPEQWQLPAPSMLLIQKACKQYSEGEVAALIADVCVSEISELKKLKMEIPALRSDHVTDCGQLAKAVDEFKKAQILELGLPLFPDRPDGGLGFPEKDKKGDEALMKKFREESLEMKRESLVFLMQNLKADWTDSDREEMLESVSTYRGVGARERLTPPLSPLLKPISDYFIPDDEDCNIPEPSEAGSMISADLEAAESRIFEDDLNFWSSVATNQLPSPDRYDDLDISEMIRAGELSSNDPFASPQPLPRDTKVDVPLFIPEREDEWQRAKTKVLDPEDLAKARTFIHSSDPVISTADVLDPQFTNFINAKAVFLTRASEQEKLQPLDATARISVPVLDFSIPALEWGSHRLTEAEMFRWIMDRTILAPRMMKWPGSKAAEMKMVWRPLEKTNKEPILSESIDTDDSLFVRFLERPKKDEVATSADCIKRRSGFAFSRSSKDDDSEIEMEDAVRSPVAPPRSKSRQPSLSGMSSKNRTRLPDSRPQSSQKLGEKLLGDSSVRSKGKKRVLDEMLQRTQPASTPDRSDPNTQIARPMNLSMLESANVLHGFMSDYTNIAPLIGNYVDMYTQKKQKTIQSHHFSDPLASATGPLIPKTQPLAIEQANPTYQQPKPILAMAPELTPPNIPPRVIISSAISKPLVDLIKSHIPDIDLLERDYNKRRPPGWYPGLRSPNADEADLTISPATGILLTTMVKLRQKPLPGKSGQVIFRHVLENVAARYENLIVLVSEGNKSDETMIPLSQSDAKVLVEFQGYAAGLQTDVRLLYVGGGNETLAKWVAAAICKHAPEASAVQDMLLPVETRWEMFLRRAGMNAYGAQVTLGTLKVPDGELAIGEGRMYGLPLFVMMEPGERIVALEDALGGRKVLVRVSQALDEPWGQHAVSHVHDVAASEMWLGEV
ncbi:hypothetical protein QBC34DRAFT_449544 [Podospora aff. communis PSN243]|uniref:Uncharacterized protein n=1 Tax=Podospora aff. communis PSN243 TaxID=3040156 RepID=A0AAV9GJX6_9PEZI|nr:hypothetical protein QBC34DRAFT_449544 [Podospora aff. communis PSN243]